MLLGEQVLAFDGAGGALVVRVPHDAFTVDEKRVAQDVELVVKDAHLLNVR